MVEPQPTDQLDARDSTSFPDALGNIPTSAPSDQNTKDHLAAIINLLQNLQRSFDEKLMYDAQKDTTIRRLHEDLDLYRRGIALAILQPLATGLMRLYDDLAEFTTSLITAAHDEGTAIKLDAQRLKDLALFNDEIEELLNRNGFRLYNGFNEVLNPGRHRPVGFMPTDDPAQDKYIAHTIKPGLLYQRADGGEQIIRPATVSVYKYTAQPE